jgi:ubiquitin thioesterase OTU1
VLIRCLLVYSGIRKSTRSSADVDYDAITLSPVESAPPSFHTTVFPVSDDTTVSTAITLVSQLKARHYYTDTSNFDLRCGVCKIGLKGEKGAREHAMLTGRKCGQGSADGRCRVWRVLRQGESPGGG